MPVQGAGTACSCQHQTEAQVSHSCSLLDHVSPFLIPAPNFCMVKLSLSFTLGCVTLHGTAAGLFLPGAGGARVVHPLLAHVLPCSTWSMTNVLTPGQLLVLQAVITKAACVPARRGLILQEPRNCIHSVQLQIRAWNGNTAIKRTSPA